MPFLILALPFLISVVMIGFEWLFSPSKFIFSRFLSLLLPQITLSFMIVLIWQPQANTESEAFVFSALARLFLTLFFVLSAVALLTAFFLNLLESGRFAPVTLTICGAVQAALYLTNSFLVTLCFVGASFFSIVAMVDLEGVREQRFVRAIRSGVRYLIASVLFGIMLFIALVFLERLKLDPQLAGVVKVAVALLVVGFALRLGIVPFNLWLPELLEETPGMSGFLVVVLINGGATIFFIDFLQKNPALILDNFDEAHAVMTLGLVGSFLAGLLALAQNGLGKMLAYTLSSNYGLILFGVASPHTTGKNGALYEVGDLALLQLLIFASLSLVYYCIQGGTIEDLSGLGRRTPAAALGLGIGFLGMCGVPLSSGFAGKYLIIQAAAQESIWWALVAGGATALCLVAYLRYFHRLFMGNDTPGLKTLPEPRGAVILILSLAGLVILIGLWPAPALEWISAALKGGF